MAVILATSEGKASPEPSLAQLLTALDRLLSRGEEPALSFIYIADEAGNELTLTHCGTLRLYLSNVPEHSYVLYLDTAEMAQSLCTQFFSGDLSWFQGQAWNRDVPSSDDEYAVATPLAWAMDIGASDMLAPLPQPEVKPPPLPEMCPRCGIPFLPGYLVHGVRGSRVRPVCWTFGGEKRDLFGGLYFDWSNDLRRVVALRCERCGHVEFRA